VGSFDQGLGESVPTAGSYYTGDHSFIGGSILPQCSLESTATLDNNLVNDGAIHLDATATIQEDAD
jgi:hypothetical protein